MDLNTIAILLVAGFALVVLLKGVRIVPQSDCLVIQRLGRYSRTLKGGFNVLVPFIDEPRDIFWVRNGRVLMTSVIDLRESVLDIPEQAVITRDNVTINIDAILYIQITDPVRATYEIQNLPQAVAQLTQTTLRNVIGEMDLDSTLASRDVINTKLKMVLDETTDRWGTKVNRVELKNITPPREIQLAMEKQMQAERERRAQVLSAEGEKQSRIAVSEGIRQEAINLSDGEREAQIRRAQGEAAGILSVAEAQTEALLRIKSVLGDSDLAARYLIAHDYLTAFSTFMQGKGDKVFVPYEATTALGGLGSIREILMGNSVSGQKVEKPTEKTRPGNA